MNMKYKIEYKEKGKIKRAEIVAKNMKEAKEKALVKYGHETMSIEEK